MTAAAFSLEKPFFSGTTGFLTAVHNDRASKGVHPDLGAEAYLAGQLDFSGKLFVRGEFYVTGNDIFDDERFSDLNKDNNALFRIEEVSATYKISGESASHYISLFKGKFEPIGSDIFLQRQFGITPIHSKLTESYHGIEGATLYPFYSIGGAYTVHTNGNNAFSVSAYRNKAKQGPEKNNYGANLDLRFATVCDFLTFDALAGLTMPLEEKDSDSNEIMNIKELQFHSGVNALLGKQRSIMLFLQLGVEKVLLKKADSDEKRLRFKDIYALCEPRIPVSDFYLMPSAFNIPASCAKDMIYLRTRLLSWPEATHFTGFNVTISNDNIYIGTTRMALGIHGTLLMEDVSGKDLKNHPTTAIDDAEKAFIVTPYASLEIFGGTISASVSVDTKEIKDHRKKNSVSGTVGFRTSF